MPGVEPLIPAHALVRFGERLTTERRPMHWDIPVWALTPLDSALVILDILDGCKTERTTLPI